MARNKASPFFILTSCYVTLILTAYLFFCGFGGYQSIFSSKLTAFYILTGTYIFLNIIIFIEMLIVGEIRMFSVKTAIKKSSISQRFIFLYMVITWISGICSPYAPNTWEGTSRGEGVLTISLYCIVFLLISVSGKIEKWMMPLLAICVTVFNLLSITQLHGANPFALYPAGYSYLDAYTAYSGAYLGTIGNVDLVAAFLCLAIPIFWISLIRSTSNSRLLLLIPLGTGLYVLIKMSVLAGLVGVICSVAITMPIVVQAPQKTKKKVCLGSLITGVLIFFVIYFYSPSTGFFYEIHELLHGRIHDTFGSGRIYIWKHVLSRIQDHFLLGHGPDTMLLVNIPSFSRVDETLGVLIESKIDVAHNEYLNILFHQGILALSAYIVALLCIAGKWLKSSSQDATVATLGGAILCYCIQACFGFSSCITAPYFWITLALLENRLINLFGGEYNEKKTY